MGTRGNNSIKIQRSSRGNTVPTVSLPEPSPLRDIDFDVPDFVFSYLGTKTRKLNVPARERRQLHRNAWEMGKRLGISPNLGIGVRFPELDSSIYYASVQFDYNDPEDEALLLNLSNLLEYWTLEFRVTKKICEVAAFQDPDVGNPNGDASQYLLEEAKNELKRYVNMVMRSPEDFSVAK